MIVIVDNVTVKYEEGTEVVVKAVEGLEKDITDFLRCASYALTVIDS
jgi:formylmethanofuran dehydrogenase subunit D